MVNEYRTHSCGELRITDVNNEVRLAGFVQTVRNLRDEKGITQIVISEETACEMKDITKECTLTVTGTVVERASKNDKNMIKLCT